MKIEIDFPLAHPRLAMFPCLTRMPRGRPRGTRPPSAPRAKEAAAKMTAAPRTIAATSFVTPIRRPSPSSWAAKLAAVRLGDSIVKSLRFESRDRERTLLAEVGESFCFPLMEKEMVETRLKNMLENAEDLSLKAFVAMRCTAR